MAKTYYYYFHDAYRNTWHVGYDDADGCFWELHSRRAPANEPSSKEWAENLTRKLNA